MDDSILCVHAPGSEGKTVYAGVRSISALSMAASSERSDSRSVNSPSKHVSMVLGKVFALWVGRIAVSVSEERRV